MNEEWYISRRIKGNHILALRTSEKIINHLWEVYKMILGIYINDGHFFLYGGGVGGLKNE